MEDRTKRRSFGSKINVDRCRLDVDLEQLLKTQHLDTLNMEC